MTEIIAMATISKECICGEGKKRKRSTNRNSGDVDGSKESRTGSALRRMIRCLDPTGRQTSAFPDGGPSVPGVPTRGDPSAEALHGHGAIAHPGEKRQRAGRKGSPDDDGPTANRARASSKTPSCGPPSRPSSALDGDEGGTDPMNREVGARASQETAFDDGDPFRRTAVRPRDDLDGSVSGATATCRTQGRANRRATKTTAMPAPAPRRKGTKARITAAIKATAQAASAASIPGPGDVPDLPARAAARRVELEERVRRLGEAARAACADVELAIESARRMYDGRVRAAEAEGAPPPPPDVMRERRERQMRDAARPCEREAEDARDVLACLTARCPRYVAAWRVHHERLCALQPPTAPTAPAAPETATSREAAEKDGDSHEGPPGPGATEKARRGGGGADERTGCGGLTERERAALARVDEAQRWALAHHHAAACRSITAEFEAEFEGAQPPVHVARHDTCAECGSPLRTSVAGSALTCGACRLNVPHMDTTTAAMSYGDDVDIAATPHKKGGHLEVKLRNFQGKSSKHIDEAVKLQVMQWHLARGFCSSADVTWKTVQTALKDLERASPKRGYYRRYYDHSMRICCLITGKPAPSMTPEQERLCRAMFMAMQETFNKWVTLLAPDRVNFISYSYCMHKFFQLKEWTHLLPYFPILKRPDKLRLQEAIWAGICYDMAWEFMPSTPPEDAPPSGRMLDGPRPPAAILADWLVRQATDAAAVAAITAKDPSVAVTTLATTARLVVPRATSPEAR